VSAGESTGGGVDVDATSDRPTHTEVVSAVLFGSHARETTDDPSDVDVALRFPDEMVTHDRFQTEPQEPAVVVDDGHAVGMVTTTGTRWG